MPRLAPRAVATNGTIRYEFSKAWADLSIRCVVQTPERGCFRLRPGPHRLDESAASYSSAGWSPPEPASASPAESHSDSISRNCKPPPRQGWGIFDRRNEEFSTAVDRLPEYGQHPLLRRRGEFGNLYDSRRSHCQYRLCG